MTGAGGANYRLYITGFPPSSEREVEQFLFSDYGCTNFYPEGQGYVAEFNDVWPQHELAALRDSLTARFRGHRFDVRYYDRGEGDAYPAYDRYDNGYAGGDNVRTIDIRGIPYNLVNEKSATDIAKQVFSSYDPLEARAFPSSGVIQITFKQPASPLEIDQMQDDLQRELLNRGKEWGRQVRVERGMDTTARVPAWGGGVSSGMYPTRGANPYDGRGRRSRYRSTNYENLGCIVAGIVTVFALLILVFFLFDPQSFCQSFGPIIGCSGTEGVANCQKEARHKAQQIADLEAERNSLSWNSSKLRDCKANKETCDELYKQETQNRIITDFGEVGGKPPPKVDNKKFKVDPKKTACEKKKGFEWDAKKNTCGKTKTKPPTPKPTKPTQLTPEATKKEVTKQAGFFEKGVGTDFCNDKFGRYIKCGKA